MNGQLVRTHHISCDIILDCFCPHPTCCPPERSAYRFEPCGVELSATLSTRVHASEHMHTAATRSRYENAIRRVVYCQCPRQLSIVSHIFPNGCAICWANIGLHAARRRMVSVRRPTHSADPTRIMCRLCSSNAHGLCWLSTAMPGAVTVPARHARPRDCRGAIVCGASMAAGVGHARVAPACPRFSPAWRDHASIFAGRMGFDRCRRLRGGRPLPSKGMGSGQFQRYRDLASLAPVCHVYLFWTRSTCIPVCQK